MNRISSLLTLMLLLVGVQQNLAQPVMMVKAVTSGVTNNSNYANFNGELFFGSLSQNGLWKSDGTVNGTVLVKSLGNFIAAPRDLTVVNGTLFFVGFGGTTGWELWKSDGTTAGTVLLKDINPGSASSSPSGLTNVNGTLFFAADDGSTGIELWKSDGTAAGTIMVKDIRPGSGHGDPGDITPISGGFIFNAVDGTNGRELWISDGTPAGTVMLKDINPFPPGSFPNIMEDVNGTIFIAADDGSNGRELWKTDGTTAGTVMVKDINPGAGSSFQPFSEGALAVNLNGIFFFNADNGSVGTELWKSDGTAAGTVLVHDINPGASSSFPGGQFFAGKNFAGRIINNALLFSAIHPTTGEELWRTDGTTAGTELVKDINPGVDPSSPQDFEVAGDTLFFAADDGATGFELWRSDGTPSGTVLVKDINPGPNGSLPNTLFNVNGTIFFAAGPNTSSLALWAVKAPITITLNPVNPPIQIPPGGGSFQFDITLENISAQSQSTQVWNIITLPNGETVGPTIGPVDPTIVSGNSITKRLTQEVRGGPPAGQYTYTFNVGTFPDTIDASDSFTFTKLSPTSGLQASASGDVGNWTVLDTETGQPMNSSDWLAIAAETAQEEPLPKGFVLEQNYPNPFNPTTTISFSLPEAGEVTLAIYNLRGQLIRTLHSGMMESGRHLMVWDGADAFGSKVASGVYVYRLEARAGAGTSREHFVATNKLVLMK